MLSQERHIRIVQEVNAKGFVSVRELAKTFDVTEDCIRKDLRVLEDQNQLERIHGGASALRQNIHAYAVENRQTLHVEEKKIIADKIVQNIPDDALIFLDISTISIMAAKKLAASHRHLSVMTNMTGVIEVLKDQKDIRLLCTGGELNDSRDGFTGALAAEAIARMRFDQAYLGAVGIDTEDGMITTYDADDVLTKKTILNQTRESYLMAEHQKFSQEGHCIYASLDEYTGLITDAMTSRQKKQISDAGLRIL
jgi:DeoR family glycerol-3-phosphate regulon repressor